MGILKNYFLISLRNFRARPLTATLSILGLATGLASCLLIGVYVHHEWSFDRFNSKSDRIFRVVQEQYTNDGRKIALTGGWLAPALIREIPEIDAAARVQSYGVSIRTGEVLYPEETILASDPSLFDIFSFKLQRGVKSGALRAPYEIVLTMSAAQKYFGSDDPIGQSVKVIPSAGSTEIEYEITGIMEDVPSTSHLQFDAITSFATIEARRPEDVEGGSRFYTYTLLEDHVDRSVVEGKLEPLLVRHLGDEARNDVAYSLQPLTTIHLESGDIAFDIHSGRSLTILYLLVAIALTALLLAILNFVSLYTAESDRRTKEICIRKLFGARRKGLVCQFICESFIIALIALPIAVAMGILLAPTISRLTGRSFPPLEFLSPTVVLSVAGLSLVTGFLAVAYPAIMLSRLSPVDAIQGRTRRVPHAASLRKVIVIFQFSITIALLGTTFVVDRQLDYVRDKELGYNEELLLSIRVRGSDRAVQRLRQIWSRISGVESVTADSRSGEGSTARRLVGRRQDSSYTWVNFYNVEHNYVESLQISLIAGRSFAANRPTDSTRAAVINVAAAEALGFTEPADALGQQLQFAKTVWEVIGVTDNYNYHSLHNDVEPLLLQWRQGSLRRIVVRLHPRNIDQTLESLGATWERVRPEFPFTYEFVEDRIAQLYEQNRRQGELFTLFSGVALLIACLGLFGLASFTIERRTQEIAVRKLLGGSVGTIAWFFVRDFLRAIGIAYVLATPITFVATRHWLSNFAYQADVGVAVLLWPAIIVVVVAMVAVMRQTISAATMNPANALRHH